MGINIDSGLLKEMKANVQDENELPMANPIPNEKVLYKSDGYSLVLTTHRIRHDRGSEVTSIMLEELRSCEMLYTSKLRFLIIGALLVLIGLGGIAKAQGDIFWLGLIIGLFLIMAYFLSRKSVLQLCSGGAAITYGIDGKSKDVAMKIIDSVEAAKNERYLAVKGESNESKA